MFIYILQLREALTGKVGVLLFSAIFSFVVWSLWFLKVLISRSYRPWTQPYSTTTTVVVPVVDEPLDLFLDVLRRIASHEPHEVIVVINGDRNVALEATCNQAKDAWNIDWMWTPVPGKRNAIREGVARASGEVVVLVDSDTIWTEDTLPELLKPFADPRIGGVTTKQRIFDPNRSFYTRWADWMENSRAHYSMPAQSVLGQVGCLPGRTIAFRRHILERAMDQFMNQEFLGVFLEVSDDRTLTNLTLKQGYRTAFQSTSLVYTDAPTRIRKLGRQQLRWARGSQYNHARMLPWMLTHAPLLAVFSICDVLLPFLLLGSAFAWIWHVWSNTGVSFTDPILRAFPGTVGWLLIGFFIVVGASLSMWLRQHRHLLDEPGDYLRMPAYVLFSSVFLMPLRMVGFFVMAHAAGWGTRQNAYSASRQPRNPYAIVPYAVGAVLIGIEIVLVVAFS